MSLPQYEVFAIRYATHERTRNDNFIFRDAHDGPMPIDFFVWVLRSSERTILVDTGFNETAAKARQRQLLRHPVDGLKAVGVDAASVRDVVLTHLHYDHAGNIGAFPAATFHVQEAEVNYATGRCMCYEPMRHAYSVDDVVDVVRNVYADRVCFHNGDATIAPGVDTAGTSEIKVTFKLMSCYADDPGKDALSEVHFKVVTEDGKSVISDMDRMIDGKPVSLVAEMKDMIKAGQQAPKDPTEPQEPQQ